MKEHARDFGWKSLPVLFERWAEAPMKIARMTLAIKLDGNWNNFN
jgi:hypothetical protein